MPRLLVFLLLASGDGAVLAAPVAQPEVLVPGAKVELVVSEPDIVTPVGMAIDEFGRLLVVESHTHKRGDDYDGIEFDRLRVLSDSNGDGWLDTWTTFAEGFTHAMNPAVHPNGDVYLVCRGGVHRLQDVDGDGVADKDDVIVRIETTVDYPHNGLGGIAVAEDGSLRLGLGENFGAAYKLIGADGSQLSGEGGVGIVFSCTADGHNLSKFAVGFWNPFALGFAGGELFAVDNDPDASPPCRLIHVLPAGDYGHRWEYGRAGTHPLQAWDGELPGTLGMMAGTGEAPCAVLEHNGWLWVTSWGEHRIERYRVVHDGKRLTADREIVVQGNADFRPTGMTVAPDGSIYFGDWVSRSYPVHGKGRIWRLTLPTKEQDLPLKETTRQAKAQLEIFRLSSGEGDMWTNATLELWPLLGVSVLESIRFGGFITDSGQFKKMLQHPDPDVRLYAVRWIADEHLTDLRDDVAKLLDGEIPDDRYYLAVLAAVDWLDGDRKPRARHIADELLLAELNNTDRPPATRALALKLLRPNLKQITIERLQDLYRTGPGPLRTEAMRTLAAQRNPRRVHLLRKVARDEGIGDDVLADVVVGLGAFVAEERELIEQIAGSGPPEARSEAKRVLRLANLAEAPAEEKPPVEQLDAWLSLLGESPGDAESGRRLFHSPLGARCAVCHKHSGRGGDIGPELTNTASKLSRRRLVESILHPSREIAPRYTPWVLETADGRVLTGLRLPKGGDDGVEPYADANGDRFELPSSEIEARSPSANSIMPSGLEKLISVQDLRDLLAFLTQQPGQN